MVISSTTTPLTDILNYSACNPTTSFYYSNQEDCSLPYVTMNAGGRLGNKLCQYMSLVLLRKTFGVRAAMLEKMNSSLSPHFPQLSLPVEDGKCFPGYTTQDIYHNLYMKLVNSSRLWPYNQLYHYPLNASVYVLNNPCPIHLLEPLREHLRRELAFREDIIKKAKQNLDKAVKSLRLNTTENITVITVHVRRTDHIDFMINKFKIQPLTKIYFQRAFNIIRKTVAHPVFVVSSDDRGWCLSNIMDKDVVFAGGADPVTDMALMTLGDHHVITYGTYGFVGAFLGRGTIFFPKNKDFLEFPCFNSTIVHLVDRF
ncbi:hypothetical protein OTU49_012143 [Cherax quadricarinatus]